MHLAHVAAEVELDTFHTTACTINAFRGDLVGVIHLAPFLRNLDAHIVVILNCGNASFTGLAVDTTACNHLIHICFICFTMQSYTLLRKAPNFWDNLCKNVMNGLVVLLNCITFANCMDKGHKETISTRFISTVFMVLAIAIFKPFGLGV